MSSLYIDVKIQKNNKKESKKLLKKTTKKSFNKTQIKKKNERKKEKRKYLRNKNQFIGNDEKDKEATKIKIIIIKSTLKLFFCSVFSILFIERYILVVRLFNTLYYIFLFFKRKTFSIHTFFCFLLVLLYFFCFQ